MTCVVAHVRVRPDNRKGVVDRGRGMEVFALCFKTEGHEGPRCFHGNCRLYRQDVILAQEKGT